MYLAPTPTRLGNGGLTIQQQRFNAIYKMAGGQTVPFVCPPNADCAPLRQRVVNGGSSPPTGWWGNRVTPQPPIRIVTGDGTTPSAAIYSAAPAQATAADATPPPPAPPAPVAANPNAGTPVPAGYPTNQLFVNSDGSLWEYSANGWVNVGTPYNTGVAATPAAPAPSPSGASTVPAAGVAPPVNVSVAPAASSYQAILDWLQTDSLASSIGFSGIPNWIVGSGVALILYKVSGKSGRR